MRKPLSSVFTRLLFYFLLVMAIPFLIFFSISIYNINSNFQSALEKQVISHVEMDAYLVESILDDYRHRAYLLSQLDEIKDAVRYRKTGENFYSSLFKTMENTLDFASAHIISLDGQLRASTHTFPQMYDFRIHSSILENDSVLARAYALKNPNKSIIALADHKADENSKTILFSIARQITNDEGATLGFVIIDIYSNVFHHLLNKTGLFTNELIISEYDYKVCSLSSPTNYGSFEKFPLLKDEKTVKASANILDNQFTLVGATDSRPYKTNMSTWIKNFSFSIAIGLAISIILSLIFSHSISKRMKKIGKKMQEIEKGNLKATLSSSGLKDVDILVDCFNLMVIKINDLMEKTREEEEKLREAERKQLESQLNPHFLFNTLNTIKAIARIHGEDDIYTISVKLGKLLRSSLKDSVNLVSIKDSLELTESYLTIQGIRFKDKIEYSIEVEEECLNTLVPKLIIQPFVDNAIVHGLEPMTEKGFVNIKICKADEKIKIVIKDNGVGFPMAINEENIVQFKNSNHVGIWNTYRRLKMHYENELEFSILSGNGDGTTVTIIIPQNKD